MPIGVVQNHNIYYVHTDQLGTPRAITDGGNSIVWKWNNTNPFGKNLPSVQNIIYNKRFAGQYFDNESNLHYNYYRTYNPLIGRYIQSDPIGLAAGFNTYNYVEGNPLGATDSLGLQTFGISIEVPNANAIQNGALNVLVDPGHVFTWTKDSKGVINTMYSFGPSKPISSNVLEFVTGNLNAVSNFKLIEKTVTSWEWKLSEEQYKECALQMKININKLQNYSMNNQCTTEANNIAKSCGITLPNAVGKIIVDNGTINLYSKNLQNPLTLYNNMTKITPGLVESVVQYQKYYQRNK